MNKTNITASTMQLADQISDEFLTCKICYEPFKEPKCLTCLHTFCEECIEQHVGAQRSYKYSDYKEFSCPICRKKTVIPTGGVRKLNDNFLIGSLRELLATRQQAITTKFCEICKLTTQRECDASLKCVECQKLMCKSCSSTHQKMKITAHHNLYALETEKDIMCKTHPNEIVRFFCEQCELCVCVACTYIDHSEHDLVDFKEAILHHKVKLEENLRKCRIKIGEIRTRLDTIKQCETRILIAHNEIHSYTLKIIEQSKLHQQEILQKIENYYGDDANLYLKKKDELELFLEQLKNTCSLGDVVIKGKDIEILLLKKQLCEKFEEYQDIHMDPIPDSLFKKILFEPGNLSFGDIKNPDDDQHELIDDTDWLRNNVTDVSSQTDTHELNSKLLRENETQTVNMQDGDLSISLNQDTLETDLISEVKPTENRMVQTDGFINRSSQGTLSSQSSIEEDHGAVQNDFTKLSKRVRKHVKAGSLLAVLPVNNDIIIIDPINNSLVILDKRGKQRYGLVSDVGNSYYEIEKNVCKFQTPQGMLTIKLENQVNDAKIDAFDKLPETTA